jgi:cyclopropane fatty-acyl-phospholipid synthase-like methyltransferase
MSLPDHLGGHKNKTHLDEGSLNHMIRILKVKSMLDIGCGPGGMVGLARSKGLDAYGIDGDFVVERSDDVKKYITIHDYEKGSSGFEKEVDLIWSVEFVEHVWEKYQENYMKDFQKGKFVIMSFAPPGKPGHHHVNCNTEEYWKNVFKKYGFQYDANLTRMIKEVSTLNVTGKFAHKAFIKNYGLCFVKS